MEAGRMTNIFYKLQSGEIKFPEQVRCARCGAMAPLEGFDNGTGEWVLGAYSCPACGWWTEWEIGHDGQGGISKSNLYYHDTPYVSSVSWYEARDWPGFWRPEKDGFTLPECATEPLEQAA
jgi:hypothetical protein